MGMRLNEKLPLPAELKAEYPLLKITEIKEKRDKEIRDILPEHRINLSYW